MTTEGSLNLRDRTLGLLEMLQDAVNEMCCSQYVSF